MKSVFLFGLTPIVYVSIYRADKCVKGENADFELTVPKTGEYTTTISASNAKGWLEVKEEEDR